MSSQGKTKTEQFNFMTKKIDGTLLLHTKASSTNLL
ncbi:hypothetical protein BS78_09G145100 [Paspalum vaginatum]|nr:hypothetical protein BS78_09G145100 [Paspalum vaginatum]